MPEIGEVARIVHYLKKHLAGKTIRAVQVQEDEIVYGKVGTSASAFQKAMTGRKVLDARQQGKYFWLVMDKPPHPVMHLGMTGWIKFSNDDTSHYRPKKEEEESWPPRFWKFILEVEEEPKSEVAFVDARRLARIRLVDAEGEQLRKTTPLKENGPDPYIDKDILTVEWLTKKMRSKKVPIKALLLDQANISGVGNWVADEVLYQARIHPEQYSNTFSDAQIKQLHDSLVEVCTIAIETLAESDRFPENWLMKHRWGKGKKDGDRLPNGAKIVHLKVGGRTSAVVPSVQKKTGAVAGDVTSDAVEEEEEEEEDEEPVKKPVKGATAAKAKTRSTAAKRTKSTKRSRTKEESEEEEDHDIEPSAGEEQPAKKEEEPNKKPKSKKRKTVDKPTPKAGTTKVKAEVPEAGTAESRRRSARLSK